MVGGGLTRSVGRWSEVVSMRRRGERQLSDERILGSGEFVQRILEEAEARIRNYYTADEKTVLGHLPYFLKENYLQRKITENHLK